MLEQKGDVSDCILSIIPIVEELPPDHKGEGNNLYFSENTNLAEFEAKLVQAGLSIALHGIEEEDYPWFIVMVRNADEARTIASLSKEYDSLYCHQC
jgi:hypothetical protein